MSDLGVRRNSNEWGGERKAPFTFSSRPVFLSASLPSALGLLPLWLGVFLLPGMVPNAVAFRTNAFALPVRRAGACGHAIYEKVQGVGFTEQTPRIATLYSWDSKSFLSESHLIREGGELSTNVLFAEGAFKGTNWKYRAQTLVLHGKPDRELADKMQVMGGRTAGEYALDRIMGRGFDVLRFLQLNIREEIIEGSYDDVLSLTGRVSAADKPLAFRWMFRPEGSSQHFEADVELAEFASDQFIPVHLRLDRVSPESDRSIQAEYILISAGTNSYYPSISPHVVYQGAKQLLLDEGEITDPLTKTVFMKNSRVVAAESASSDTVKWIRGTILGLMALSLSAVSILGIKMLGRNNR